MRRFALHDPEVGETHAEPEDDPVGRKVSEQAIYIWRKRIDGIEVRVFSAAKTIADCFKFRNKIGLDVALEALREGWSERKVTMDELWRYAGVDRVANVMRPYLEAVAA